MSITSTKIRNVKLIYDDNEIQGNNIFLGSDQICITHDRCSNVIIEITDESQIIVLRLGLYTSPVYQYTKIEYYNIAMNIQHKAHYNGIYIGEYNSMYPLNDIIPLYINAQIDLNTGELTESYFYESVIIEKGNVYESLNIAIENNTFDIKSAKTVPNLDKYIRAEINNQLNNKRG